LSELLLMMIAVPVIGLLVLVNMRRVRQRLANEHAG